MLDTMLQPSDQAEYPKVGIWDKFQNNAASLALIPFFGGNAFLAASSGYAVSGSVFIASNIVRLTMGHTNLGNALFNTVNVLGFSAMLVEASIKYAMHGNSSDLGMAIMAGAGLPAAYNMCIKNLNSSDIFTNLSEGKQELLHKVANHPITHAIDKTINAPFELVQTGLEKFSLNKVDLSKRPNLSATFGEVVGFGLGASLMTGSPALAGMVGFWTLGYAMTGIAKPNDKNQSFWLETFKQAKDFLGLSNIQSRSNKQASP
jgi:hypothetical protein